MFGKILGRSKKEESTEDREHNELVLKIAKMNLTDMKSYVNGRVADMSVTEDGLIELMKKLITIDETTSKRYIEIDDMDSKIKKGFELVLSIGAHKKITVVTVELIQEFMEIYSDIITKYDTTHKQIYSSRLKDVISKAASTLNEMAEMRKKMGVLGI